MKLELIGAVLAAVAALFFAANVIMIRKATVKGKPLDAVMAFLWIGTILFLPSAIIIYYPDLGLNIRSLMGFVYSGVTGMFLGRLLYYEGSKRVGPSKTVAIARGSLIISSGIGIIFLGENITLEHFIGIIILLIGVILVSVESQSEDSVGNWNKKDLLFPFGAMALWGIAAAIIKYGLTSGTPLLVGMAIQFTSGFIFLSLHYLRKKESPLKPFKLEQTRIFVAAGLIYSTAMLFYYMSLSISRVTVTTPLRGITPLFTIILSVVFIKKLETRTITLVIGSILVLAGSIFIGISL